MAQAPSLEQVGAAFRQHEASIVSQQAELSLRDVRRLLVGSLDIPADSLECPEVKDWVAVAVQRSLQRAAASATSLQCHPEQQGLPGSMRQVGHERQRCAAEDLPPEVLTNIMASLDDDQDLVNALATCRAWHAAGSDVSLWQARMTLLRPGARQSSDDGRRASAAAAYDDPKCRYQQAARRVCFDCRRLDRYAFRLRVPQSAPPTARLVVRLCNSCRESYRHTTPQQRLITHGTAQFRFRLRFDKDLAPLPSALAPNPIDDRFVLMRLSRLSAVRCAAIRQWGSEDAMLRQMRRPHWED